MSLAKEVKYPKVLKIKDGLIMNTSHYAVGTIPKVVVAVVVIVVILVGLYAIIPAATKTSTTTSQTTTSSQTSAVSSTSRSSTVSSTSQSSGSAVVTGSGSPLAIAISQVISDPPEAKPSSSVYIYNVTLTNIGQTPYLINASYFSLIGASNAVYNPMMALAIQQVLRPSSLTQGKMTTGQVAFQIPTSETPAKIEYHVPLSIDEFITNLPTPSGFVSEFLTVNTHVQGTPDGYGGQMVAAYASVLNSSNAGFFYSGQTIEIGIALLDGYTGTNATVNTIVSATSGLSINQIQPSLPVHMTGSDDGSTEVLVYVFMIVPATSLTGPINLNLTGTG